METRTSVPDGLAIALFRLQAQALFHTWAAGWLHFHHPLVERDDLAHARLMSTAIQTVYWNALHRNPTVHEWVRDFIKFTADPVHTIPEHYDYQLRCLCKCEDRLDVLKSWKQFHQGYPDDRTALNAYSYAVGSEFVRHSAQHLELAPELDWLSRDRIWNVMRDASGAFPKKLSLKARVQRFFRCVKPSMM